MAQQPQNNLILTGKSQLSVLLMLSWPAIIEQLLLTAVGYVDAAMVGALGANATAAVAITSSTTWMVNGLFMAAGVGFSVQVAQSIGAGDFSRTRLVMRQAVMGTVVFSVGMTALVTSIAWQIPRWMGAAADVLPDARLYIMVYAVALPFFAISNIFSALLRSMGDTRTPLFINALTNVLNIFMNFLFIYSSRDVSVFGIRFRMWGAGWGVMGASLATSLAMLLGALLLAWSLYHRAEPYKIYVKDRYRPDRAVVRETFRLGLPVAMDRIFLSTGQIIMTRIIASLGTISLAANHIAVTAESVSYLPAVGISYAATTLVGQSIGARRSDLSMRYGTLSAKVSFLFSGCMGVLLFLFAQPLASIFSPDPDVIAQATLMLRIVSLAQPLFGVSIVLAGVLRGAGDTKWPFYITLFGMWAVRMPLAPLLVYAFKLGLAGVWIAMFVDLNLRGIVILIRLVRGKWNTLPPEPGPAAPAE